MSNGINHMGDHLSVSQLEILREAEKEAVSLSFSRRPKGPVLCEAAVSLRTGWTLHISEFDSVDKPTSDINNAVNSQNGCDSYLNEVDGYKSLPLQENRVEKIRHLKSTEDSERLRNILSKLELRQSEIKANKHSPLQNNSSPSKSLTRPLPSIELPSLIQVPVCQCQAYGLLESTRAALFVSEQRVMIAEKEVASVASNLRRERVRCQVMERELQEALMLKEILSKTTMQQAAGAIDMRAGNGEGNTYSFAVLKRVQEVLDSFDVRRRDDEIRRLAELEWKTQALQEELLGSVKDMESDAAKEREESQLKIANLSSMLLELQVAKDAAEMSIESKNAELLHLQYELTDVKTALQERGLQLEAANAKAEAAQKYADVAEIAVMSAESERRGIGESLVRTTERAIAAETALRNLLRTMDSGKTTQSKNTIIKADEAHALQLELRSASVEADQCLEIAQLINEVIYSQDACVRAFKAEYDALVDKYKDVSEQLVASEKKFNISTEKYAAMEIVMRTTEKELEENRLRAKQTGDVNNMLDASKQSQLELQQQQQALLEELNTTKANLEKNKNLIKFTKEKVVSLEAECKSSKQSQLELQQQQQALLEELNTTKANLEKTKNLIKFTEEKVVLLEAERTSNKDDKMSRNELQSQVEDLENRLKSSDSHFKEAVRQYKESKAKRQQLQEECDQNNIHLSTKDATITALQSQLRELKDADIIKDSAIIQKNSIISDLQLQLEDANDRVSSSQRTIESHRDKYIRRLNELEALILPLNQELQFLWNQRSLESDWQSRLEDLDDSCIKIDCRLIELMKSVTREQLGAVDKPDSPSSGRSRRQSLYSMQADTLRTIQEISTIDENSLGDDTTLFQDVNKRAALEMHLADMEQMLSTPIVASAKVLPLSAFESSYESRIFDLEDRLERLSIIIADAQREDDEKENVIKSQQQSLDTAQSQIKSHLAKISKLEDDIRAWEVRHTNQMKNILEERKKEKSIEAEQTAALKATIDSLLHDQQFAEDRITSDISEAVTTKVAAMTSEIEVLRARVKELETRSSTAGDSSAGAASQKARIAKVKTDTAATTSRSHPSPSSLISNSDSKSTSSVKGTTIKGKQKVDSYRTVRNPSTSK